MQGSRHRIEEKNTATQYETGTLAEGRCPCFGFILASSAARVPGVQRQLSVINDGLFRSLTRATSLFTLSRGEKKIYRKKNNKSKLTHHPLVKLFNSPEP